MPPRLKPSVSSVVAAKRPSSPPLPPLSDSVVPSLSDSVVPSLSDSVVPSYSPKNCVDLYSKVKVSSTHKVTSFIFMHRNDIKDCTDWETHYYGEQTLRLYNSICQFAPQDEQSTNKCQATILKYRYDILDFTYNYRDRFDEIAAQMISDSVLFFTDGYSQAAKETLISILVHTIDLKITHQIYAGLVERLVIKIEKESAVGSKVVVEDLWSVEKDLSKRDLP